jgi:hypothetical protein
MLGFLGTVLLGGLGTQKLTILGHKRHKYGADPGADPISRPRFAFGSPAHSSVIAEMVSAIVIQTASRLVQRAGGWCTWRRYDDRWKSTAPGRNRIFPRKSWPLDKNYRQKSPKKAVDGLSRSLQSRSKLVESPFPPRNQTWKQTFWTGTRKPNSFPLKVKARIS